MNTYGQYFRLTTFGESHGAIIGGVIDGCPAGLVLDQAAVQAELDLRRPGNSFYTSPRNEPDEVEFVSGIYQGLTTGMPIAFFIQNRDVRSADYAAMYQAYRPGHADYTYDAKYGVRDPRGGGRSSARETACRIVGGAVARQLLAPMGIRVQAYVSAIGMIRLKESCSYIHSEGIRNRVYQSVVRCPDTCIENLMTAALSKVQAEGDSLGGVVSCEATLIPCGWGEPVYAKLSAQLALAMMSINAARGFELGDGFAIAACRGSQANDLLLPGQDGQASFDSNHNGGILGGISTGQDIRLRVAFKPTSTISKAQQTIDRTGKAVVLAAGGRHDPCVAIRAVPVVEAMCTMTLADAYLAARISAPVARLSDI